MKKSLVFWFPLLAALVLASENLEARHLWTRGVGGVGTATIDGVLSPGEWIRAGHYDLLVNVPQVGTARATLFVMNDSTNLYLALRFERSVVDPGNSLFFEFDTNNSGVLDDGDDATGFTPGVGFFDNVRTSAPPCPPGSLCGLEDTSVGGTKDGAGAFLNNGTFTVYEMSHPLNSGDDNDFALAPRDTIDFFLSLRIIGGSGEIVDTTFPGFGDSRARIRIR